MRGIILNNVPFECDIKDLPLLVHGKEGSGASLFSILVAVSLCRMGRPLFFWSAYPMAKEEFRKEFGEDVEMHSIQQASEITDAEPQIIVMENGDPEQLIAALPKIDSNRILFVKNF